MTSSDGLNLDQVQAQWRESQRLLDELRGRLESLAAASQSAATATVSIQNSERALADLVADQAKMSVNFSRAHEAAVEALEALNKLTQAADIGRLAGQMQQIAETVTSIEEAGQSLRKEQAEITRKVTEHFSHLEEALKKTASDDQALQRQQQEFNEFRQAVNQAINGLPGRFQSRFRDALR